MSERALPPRQRDTMLRLAERTPDIQTLARRSTRSGVFELRGYWPRSNDQPMFAVRPSGGWVEMDDLVWLRDQLIALLDPDRKETPDE